VRLQHAGAAARTRRAAGGVPAAQGGRGAASVRAANRGRCCRSCRAFAISATTCVPAGAAPSSQLLLPMAAKFGGLFLGQPDFSNVIALDMSSGEAKSPPPGWWEAVARAIAPTPVQVRPLACVRLATLLLARQILRSSKSSFALRGARL
jgi:hypothetical protein